LLALYQEDYRRDPSIAALLDQHLYVPSGEYRWGRSKAVLVFRRAAAGASWVPGPRVHSLGRRVVPRLPPVGLPPTWGRSRAGAGNRHCGGSWLPIGALAVIAVFLPGCTILSPHKPRPGRTGGQICVDRPEVYSRERLVQARYARSPDRGAGAAPADRRARERNERRRQRGSRASGSPARTSWSPA
jgi:hypothetical protein